MKRIRISGLAERDLDDIWDRIATGSGSTTIADRVVDSATEVFRIFSRRPKLDASEMKSTLA